MFMLVGLHCTWGTQLLKLDTIEVLSAATCLKKISPSVGYWFSPTHVGRVASISSPTEKVPTPAPDQAITS